MGNSLSGDLFMLGFGVGAGLGVASGPFILLAMLGDKWLEHRRRQKLRSRRRPPSLLAVTQDLPKVVE